MAEEKEAGKRASKVTSLPVVDLDDSVNPVVRSLFELGMARLFFPYLGDKKTGYLASKKQFCCSSLEAPEKTNN